MGQYLEIPSAFFSKLNSFLFSYLKYYCIHFQHFSLAPRMTSYTEYLTKQALLCSIELGSIKRNLETAKMGILPWENMSTTIAKLPTSDFAHL